MGPTSKYGFTPLEILEGQSEARPRPTAMWLPIQTVKTASGPAHWTIPPGA